MGVTRRIINLKEVGLRQRFCSMVVPREGTIAPESFIGEADVNSVSTIDDQFCHQSSPWDGKNWLHLAFTYSMLVVNSSFYVFLSPCDALFCTIAILLRFK
ncbi:hypothetical protein Mapa_012062 [Marchantia paleacea]|nr:hypothetical protein Mapa_012062 [Marchantia paleacea]